MSKCGFIAGWRLTRFFIYSRAVASCTLCLVPRLVGTDAEAYEIRNMAELGWDKAALIFGIFRCLLALPPAAGSNLPLTLEIIATDPEFEAGAFQNCGALMTERWVVDANKRIYFSSLPILWHLQTLGADVGG